MLTFKDFILETSKAPYAPTVFHHTNVHNAAAILKGGKFNLSSAVGTPTDQDSRTKNTDYFLSTARSASGDYAKSNSYYSGVQFELNRDHIANNHKIIAKDYWGPAFRKMGRSSEQEDRVISPKPHIPIPKNPTDLIRAIHVFHDFSKEKSPPDNRDLHHHVQIRSVLLHAKANNIPVHVYDDPKHFLTTNTAKALPISSIISKFKGNPEGPMYSSNADYLKNVRELAQTHVDSFSKTKHNKRMWSTPGPDSIAADLHNATKSSNPSVRAGLEKTVSLMKKVGVSTPKEFSDYISRRWEKKRGY